MIALWLERKYFSQNTRSPAARSTPKLSIVRLYSAIAMNAAAAADSISVRSEPQNQPRPMSTGAASSRMPFS